MALEKEIKFESVDHAILRQALQGSGADLIGRWFEMNRVFDTPNRDLKAAGKLLRLRRKGDKAVLTVKSPPKEPVSSQVKVFEENETGVEDFDATQAALEALGYSVAFAYEKVREKWRCDECSICLDTLPFGTYVEVEGPEAAIFACVEKLGLQGEKTTIETYHALNLKIRAGRGLPYEESFVFSDEERTRLLLDLSS